MRSKNKDMVFCDALLCLLLLTLQHIVKSGLTATEKSYQHAWCLNKLFQVSFWKGVANAIEKHDQFLCNSGIVNWHNCIKTEYGLESNSWNIPCYSELLQHQKLKGDMERTHSLSGVSLISLRGCFPESIL